MAGQFRRHRAQLSLRVPRFEFRVRFLLLSSSGPSCSPPEIFSVGILCGASACREAAERFRRHPEQFYPQVLRCAVQVRVWPLLPSSDTSELGRNFRFEFLDLNFEFDSFFCRLRVHPVPLQKSLALEFYVELRLAGKRQNGFAAIRSNSILKFFDVQFKFEFGLFFLHRIPPSSGATFASSSSI